MGANVFFRWAVEGFIAPDEAALTSPIPGMTRVVVAVQNTTWSPINSHTRTVKIKKFTYVLKERVKRAHKRADAKRNHETQGTAPQKECNGGTISCTLYMVDYFFLFSFWNDLNHPSATGTGCNAVYNWNIWLRVNPANDIKVKAPGVRKLPLSKIWDSYT